MIKKIETIRVKRVYKSVNQLVSRNVSKWVLLQNLIRWAYCIKERLGLLHRDLLKYKELTSRRYTLLLPSLSFSSFY